VARVSVSFFRDQFITHVQDFTVTWTYRLEPGQEPKAIDFIRAPGDALPGIYRLDGDRLQLCLSVGGNRPTDFIRKPDPQLWLYELHRMETAPPAGAAGP
jgi:uncharacterized protein (TIGR03067 family)